MQVFINQVNIISEVIKQIKSQEKLIIIKCYKYIIILKNHISITSKLISFITCCDMLQVFIK